MTGGNFEKTMKEIPISLNNYLKFLFHLWPSIIALFIYFVNSNKKQPKMGYFCSSPSLLREGATRSVVEGLESNTTSSSQSEATPP